MAMKTEPFVVNIGPQHPSTHGVFRMRLTLDGERITDADMVIGYLHRSMEKLAEERSFTQVIPFTDRTDYVAAMTGNLAYVLAVEKLCGIEAPERAQWLRVIMSELQRFASHSMAVGVFANDCGAWQTPVMHMFREREKILDLFEMACGARLTTNYMRIGGVSRDIPPEFMPAAHKLLAELPTAHGRVRGPPGGERDHRRAVAGRGGAAGGAGDRHFRQRADAAGQRRGLGHPQGGPVRGVRQAGVRHLRRHQRRRLRPLPGQGRGDAAEHPHPGAGAGR